MSRSSLAPSVARAQQHVHDDPLRRERVLSILSRLERVGIDAIEQAVEPANGGEAFFLPTPGVAGSAETARIYLNDPFVRATTDRFDQVTLALVGIGTVEPSKLLASSGNIFSAEELDLLRESGASGDICLRFFDQQGVPVLTPLNDRVIGMQLEHLQKVARSVGIAGGQRKFQAIRGALAGRWINVLITDRRTAEALIEDVRSRQVSKLRGSQELSVV